jgi:hypothetical protein
VVVVAVAQEVAIMEAQAAVLEILTLIPMAKTVAMVIKHQVTELGQVVVVVVWLLLELTQPLAAAQLVMVVTVRRTGALGVLPLQQGSYRMT